MLTPEQQADYDYAMSQLKPKKLMIDYAKIDIPSITIKIDPTKFNEAFTKTNESMRKYRDSLDAVMFAMMGIPKSIFEAPNCRCTILPSFEKLSTELKAKVIVEKGGLDPRDMSEEQIDNLYNAIVEAEENIAKKGQ